MLSNVELYEALKPTVGQEAARMLAEAVPKSQEFATRADIAELRHDLELAMQRMETRLVRLMLANFIPLWLGVWAAVGVALFK